MFSKVPEISPCRKLPSSQLIFVNSAESRSSRSKDEQSVSARGAEHGAVIIRANPMAAMQDAMVARLVAPVRGRSRNRFCVRGIVSSSHSAGFSFRPLVGSTALKVLVQANANLITAYWKRVELRSAKRIASLAYGGDTDSVDTSSSPPMAAAPARLHDTFERSHYAIKYKTKDS